MRKHSIRVLPGDRVVVEPSLYDVTRDRITFRLRLEPQNNVEREPAQADASRG